MGVLAGRKECAALPPRSCADPATSARRPPIRAYMLEREIVVLVAALVGASSLPLMTKPRPRGDARANLPRGVASSDVLAMLDGVQTVAGAWSAAAVLREG